MASTWPSTAGEDIAVDREVRAVELRVQHQMTYSQIAVELGYAQESGARRAVERGLAARVAQQGPLRDMLIGVQLEILGEIFTGLRPKAKAGDARAAEVLLKGLDRHAKLFGLDAPIQHHVDTPMVTADQLIALIQQADGDGADS